MTARRFTGLDSCPLDGLVVTMDQCQPCPYFRGAAAYPNMPPRSWSVSCNWPRDGSSIDPNPSKVPVPDVEPGSDAVPDAFRW